MGIFFLISPILGVIAFVLCLFDINSDFSMLSNLSSDWTTNYGYDKSGGVGMSAAPIYLGLMTIVGAYLIKISARYIISEDTNKIDKEGNSNE